MAIHSITRRWLLNSVGLLIGVLVALDVAFFFVMQNVYYSGVEQAMRTRAGNLSVTLSSVTADPTTNLSTEIRGLVENFSDKAKMELMAINYQGNIAVTSSGFGNTGIEEMPDYDAALENDDGTGTFIGRISTGEKVLAVTRLIQDGSSDYVALRLVTSLSEVDQNIWIMVLLFSAVCAVIVTVTVLSGSYFVRSIVMPVRQVRFAAQKIAEGELDVRIPIARDDEMGELCVAINHMADELENSKNTQNEFISSISHELRTPLTAIRGWGETLQSTPNDVLLMEKGMDVILTETERLSEMVEELLDFSRLQNGRFTLVRSKMDVLAELGEVVVMYNPRARHDRITLVYDEPEMLPFVFGDRNRLRQVFINIIDNAIKYSNAGGTVTVTARAADGVVRITVADMGIGIPKKDLPYVKQKFYKADVTRRGSGIGLAVANEIIAMHDGTLTVDSVEGIGTTVVIELPVMEEGETRAPEITMTGETASDEGTV